MRTFLALFLLMMNVSLCLGSETLIDDCASTFVVQDKKFPIENQTLSCKSLNEYKDLMYIQLNDLDKNTDFKPLIENVKSLQRELSTALESKDFEDGKDNWTVRSNGVLMAVLLVTCPEIGVGCIASAITYVNLTEEYLNAIKSLKDRQKALKQLQLKLSEVEKILNNKSIIYNSTRANLRQSYNKLCKVFLEKCVEDKNIENLVNGA